jgi:hypothetical protein
MINDEIATINIGVTLKSPGQSLNLSTAPLLRRPG